MSPLDFETHEWEKHGRCAGVKNVEDFFSQVCSLAEAPLKVMAAAKKSGHADLAGYASQLEGAGYSVYDTDEVNMQLQLSACATSDGTWTLAAVAEFGSKCPGGDGPPAPTPARCEPNVRGPPCDSDDDCALPGCTRCAHSGFCTAQNAADAALLANATAKAR